MKDKQAFLIKFLKFAGGLEIYISFLLFFAGFIMPRYFGIEAGLPLLYQMAGVELFILGFLLWYSAKDVQRYLVIILASCAFRFIMPVWPEIYAIISLWPHDFAIILIPAMIYDVGSAAVTLVLLHQAGYLKRQKV